MGINLEEIRELLQLVEKADVSEFHVENEGIKITIKKTAEAPVMAAAPPLQVMPNVQHISAEVQSQEAVPSNAAVEVEDSNLHKIVSPMVGTFYRAAQPEAEPFIKEGETVHTSSTVCIIEAMKLMNEIDAEVNGKIEKILVENGQLVEYGQPLFLVRTNV